MHIYLHMAPKVPITWVYFAFVLYISQFTPINITCSSILSLSAIVPKIFCLCPKHRAIAAAVELSINLRLDLISALSVAASDYLTVARDRLGTNQTG